jgi:hypothetical protein
MLPLMLVGMGLQVASGIFGASASSKAARRAAQEKARLQKELNSLEASRQAIINPYEGVKDVSGLAVDLSGSLSNPFANLGVATQAAKFEAEQIDMSLANTLDTLKETGASAGGATALAQAALKSKQGISANIEQQEASNEKLKAQGEQTLQQLKMSEAQRIQGVQISEAQRVQEGEAKGKAFVFETREGREVAKMNRVAGQLGQAQAQESQANADRMGAITGMIGGLASTAGSAAMAGGGAAGGGSTTFGSWGGQVPAFPGSDRRLKYNIIHIGKSNKGLNIYSFKYKDEKFGKGLFQGVMSDEIPSNAVIKGSDGYDRVNYSLLDVEFKQI